MKAVLISQVLLFILPWALRRRLLQWLYGYEIEPTARIGYSILNANSAILSENSRIGHLTMIKGLEKIVLSENARIGNLNWITGIASSKKHFTHQPERRSKLEVGAHSAITHRHLIDCTGSVEIGQFSTFAGWRSQIVSHAIDLRKCRQDAGDVRIGDYCFVGSSVVLLKNSSLPSYSVLAAGSVLSGTHDEEYSLYSGLPATRVRELPRDTQYFKREVGFVN